jgi:hypothetical protein
MCRIVVVDGVSNTGVGDEISRACANIAARQAGRADVGTAPGWEIDGVDGWTLSVRLRQGHRPLAVREG